MKLRHELGNDWKASKDVMYEDRLKPVEMQRPRQLLENFTSGCCVQLGRQKVRVLECNHVSTREGMMTIGSHRTWKKVAQCCFDIDIDISKTVSAENRTTYQVNASPAGMRSHDADLKLHTKPSRRMVLT